MAHFSAYFFFLEYAKYAPTRITRTTTATAIQVDEAAGVPVSEDVAVVVAIGVPCVHHIVSAGPDSGKTS